jgi:hypothetical protein
MNRRRRKVGAAAVSRLRTGDQQEFEFAGAERAVVVEIGIVEFRQQ